MDPVLHDGIRKAKALVAEGQYSEAAEVFQDLIEKETAGREVLEALSDTMAEVGQLDASLALLADSIDEAAPDPAALLKLVGRLEDAGRFEEAADFLLCAICCSPEDVSLRERTENVLESLGRVSQLDWLRSGGEGEIPPA